MTPPKAWYPVPTVSEALDVLLDILSEDRDLTVDRTVDAESLEALQVALGPLVRQRFGLTGENPRLLEDCGTMDAGKASSIIIRDLWQRMTED